MVKSHASLSGPLTWAIIGLPNRVYIVHVLALIERYRQKSDRWHASDWPISACIRSTYMHGRIIKWTQHIGFLTLAGMEQVVEGNHGNDLKEG